MLPGPRAATTLPDSAEPLGWRVANALAIASPYLVAAVLFAFLYLQPASPPAHAALVTPPAPASDVSGQAEPAAPAEATPTAAVPSGAAAPARVKNVAAPAAAPAIAAPPAALPADGSAASAATPVSTPAPAKEPALPTQPVPVDPVIAGTMKLSGDPPDYPAVASHAQIQGTVVLAATIGPDGAVQSLEPVSGPALLEAAFIGAARSWRYRPYLIYGHPVAFQTQISITFRLNAPPQ